MALSLRGRALVVSPADPEADSEVKAVSLLGLAVLAAVAALGYGLRRAAWLGRPGRSGTLAALWVGCAVAPFAVLHAHGPFRSLLAHFTLAFLGVVGSFRLLELILGTGPRGFDRSFKNFIVYFSSPAEVLFDEAGEFKRSPPGRLMEILLRLAAHMLMGAVLLSVGKATDFVPFLERGSRPVEMPHFGLPASLPGLWLQAAFVYCLLTTAMLMHRVPVAMLGIDTVDPMRAPLLLSTSVRDFWGRRWNLLIHRLMKRTFFAPLARGSPGAGRHLGGLLAFAMSGLFHEYMWFAVNWFQVGPATYVPGQVLLFFLVQFCLCAAEAALAGTRAGRWASGLPAGLRTAGTTLVTLPAAPLFLHGLHGAGMMAQCAEQSATLDLLPRGADAAGLRQTVPLDWACLAAFASAVLGLRCRARLRARAWGGAGKAARLATQVDGASTLVGG
ncbi:unnamed protein product [Prorocentrum cordatum]|uniref:Wax synthase domain-containing protein n=1 Tax=Prorocentrum cordatum TaxID=2364126 RepID=A0ABN9Y361_9DINO|nr:unnamed protein product [Polarella glacialis]